MDDLFNRPAFAQMLTDAESRLFNVIVVHKLVRFARNLRVTLETLDRLDKSGVAFISFNERTDFTTPIRKVILATLATFAQYYSGNLSAEPVGTDAVRGIGDKRQSGRGNHPSTRLR